MAKQIRDTRELLPIASLGGFLEIQWCTAANAAGYEKWPKESGAKKLDVQQWRLKHKFTNVRLPLSGGKGALTRRRVADDFEFQAIVAMDIGPGRASAGNTFADQPFLDGRLEGKSNVVAAYRIAVLFQCGDPTFYTDPELQTIARVAESTPGLYYFCSSVLLKSMDVINDTLGKAVVLAIVEGEGSAPLERYIDNVKEPIGFGGLGFKRDKKEEA